MPWHHARSEECPSDKPWAVIADDTGEIVSCNETEEGAMRHVRALYANVPEARSNGDMRHKTIEAEVKADDPELGTFTALASVFGNVDRGGDRMMPGAFKNTLERLRKAGKTLPIILSHQWDNLTAYVGKADPRAVYEDERGLVVQGELFMDEPEGRKVHKLMKEGLLTGWSFGYQVPKGGERVKDGVTEVSEVDLFEVGPCLVGMNPEAQLQTIKSTTVVEDVVLEEPQVEASDPPPPDADLRRRADKLERERIAETLPPAEEDKTYSEVLDRLRRANGAQIHLIERALDAKVTDAAWDGSASRFTDEQYARSCVLDRAKCGDGEMTTRQRYSLPVREPGGELNRNAVHAAASRIGQVDACPEAVAAAKSALRRAYGELGEDAPDSIKASVNEGRNEEPDGVKSPPDEQRRRAEAVLLDVASGGLKRKPAPATPPPPDPLDERELRRRTDSLMLELLTGRSNQ